MHQSFLTHRRFLKIQLRQLRRWLQMHQMARSHRCFPTSPSHPSLQKFRSLRLIRWTRSHLRHLSCLRIHCPLSHRWHHLLQSRHSLQSFLNCRQLRSLHWRLTGRYFQWTRSRQYYQKTHSHRRCPTRRWSRCCR
jgi:hypothetical protein